MGSAAASNAQLTNYNTLLGFNAGNNSEMAQYNTLLGPSTKTVASVSFATALGYLAQVDKNNQVALGRENIGTEIKIGGYIHFPTGGHKAGSQVPNGSLFKGTDGALYYKSDAGTVTQLAPN